MGKGAAIITAIEHMRGDIGLIQDADLEYDPADYPALVAPILEGKADAVFGSRFASASQRKILLYWHGVANHFLTWLTNILNDINLTDMETCYKAVRADILKQTPLYSDRFGIEPELTTKLAQWNIRLYEVPDQLSRAHRRRGEEDRLEGRGLGGLDAAEVPLHRRSVHDPRRLLRAPEHAPRARPEPLDPGAVPPVSSATACSRPAAASATSPSCCSIASGWSASTTIRSTSRWRTGASAISRTCGRCKADLADPAAYAQLKPEQHRHDHLPQRARAHRGGRAGAARATTICSSRAATPSSWCPRTCGSTARATRRSATCAATRRPSCTPRCRRPASRSCRWSEFNRLGVPGWWLNKQLGRRDLNPRQMRLFELLLPIAKGMEALKLGRGPQPDRRRPETLKPIGRWPMTDERSRQV